MFVPPSRLTRRQIGPILGSVMRSERRSRWSHREGGRRPRPAGLRLLAAGLDLLRSRFSQAVGSPDHGRPSSRQVASSPFLLARRLDLPASSLFLATSSRFLPLTRSFLLARRQSLVARSFYLVVSRFFLVASSSFLLATSLFLLSRRQGLSTSHRFLLRYGRAPPSFRSDQRALTTSKQRTK